MGGQHGLPADAKRNPDLQLHSMVYGGQDSMPLSANSETPSSDELPTPNCSIAEINSIVDQVAQFDTKLDIRRLDFMTDSQHLIVAGPSGFGLLEWKTGKLVSKVVIYLNSLPGCIALCPQSQGAICGLKDGTLAYCKCTMAEGTKAPHRILTGHHAPIVGVCMTSDGRLAVSAAETVRTWRLEEHTPEQEDAAMAAFGVATVHEAPTATSTNRLIQLRGYCFGTLTGGKAAFTCVSIAPKGFSVAAGCKDGAVHVWSTICGHIARTFVVALTRKAKTHPEYSLDSQALRIILQGYLRNPKLHQFRLQQILTGHSASVCALAFTPNGNGLVSAGQDQQLCIWSGSSGDASLIGVDGPVHSICMSCSGHLALCATPGTLYICDPSVSCLVYSFSVAPCVAVALSADSRYAAVVGKRVLGTQVTVYQIVPLRGALGLDRSAPWARDTSQSQR